MRSSWQRSNIKVRRFPDSARDSVVTELRQLHESDDLEVLREAWRKSEKDPFLFCLKKLERVPVQE
jgi:hypothetical protein